MTQREAEAAVIRAITQIQRDSGRQCPRITKKTIPIGGVPGFDSFNGLEAMLEIGKHLGADLPDDARCFTNALGQEGPRIEEIARRVRNHLEKCEDAAHGK